MEKIKQYKKQIIIAVIAIILIGYYLFSNQKENVVTENLTDFTLQNTVQNEVINPEENIEETILVHVAGQVANPGVVELKQGDRIQNAIEKAGGILETANLSNINLASFVEDGMKIYIPSVTENNEINISSQEEAVLNSKININTANQTQLEELEGIGEITALRIIEYRKQNGKFKTIEDLKNVKGIGDAKFDKIKDDIEV